MTPPGLSGQAQLYPYPNRDPSPLLRARCDFTPPLMVTTTLFGKVQHHPFPPSSGKGQPHPYHNRDLSPLLRAGHKFTSILIVPYSVDRARFDITPILIVTTPLFVQG